SFEPRGWSAMHVYRGNPSNSCRGAWIHNNRIGPSGDGDPPVANQWADGISRGCFRSLVGNNTIVDPTDGRRVVFGAPGATVRNNTIRAATRSLLGGINMVDYTPTSGDYTGTIVENNTVDASGALIRVGIAMGPRVWFDCSITQVNRGGTVRSNTLTGSHM